MPNQKKDVKQQLADSFKELVCQKPVEKVTIKEIADRAGVIRPTFYNHFQDKYDLLEWVISHELIDPIKPLILNDMVEEAITFLFVMLEKHRTFYLQISKLEGQSSFVNIVQHCVEGLLLDVFEEHGKRKQPKYEWLTAERLAKYYGYSFTFSAIQWLQSGMNISIEEAIEIHKYIISHSLEDSLKDL